VEWGIYLCIGKRDNTIIDYLIINKSIRESVREFAIGNSSGLGSHIIAA